MQAPMPQPTNIVLDVLRSPAVVIGACAVFVRWVIGPAVTNYMRQGMQDELRVLGQFPLFVERVKTVELAIERLSEIPEALARIEATVESLHQERRVNLERRVHDA